MPTSERYLPKRKTALTPEEVDYRVAMHRRLFPKVTDPAVIARAQGLTKTEVKASLRRLEPATPAAPAVPPPSAARQATLVGHGIREGELFAVYSMLGGVLRNGFLARWRGSDNPRMFELVEEEGGASMQLGYSSRLWAVKLGGAQ